MAPRPRKRLGWILTILGLALILFGVFHVLNAVGYAEGRKFENRRSYNQVKVAVHDSYPLGFAVGLGGLGLAMLGSRLRAAPAAPAGEVGEDREASGRR